MRRYAIGVDVGTASARAGVFDTEGHMLASVKREFSVWHDAGGVVEQSSEEIWAAVCACVREALSQAAVSPDEVAGLGFDATCSLVVLGAGGAPIAAGPSGDPRRNIIVWMDHRAVAQAGRINAGRHAVLKYVGGRISPEMQTPKLLWLRENLPAQFDAAWQFFDLPDFLSWRATGDLARSTCTLTCKWTYLAHERRWDAAYFHEVGLGELADEQFARIGQQVFEPGTPLGAGLTEQAARDLGLRAGTPVGASLIDAHAGGIGTVGVEGDATRSLGYVFGTSSCTMTSTREPVFVPGVWGPYYSAMVPGLWLNEGGQSAAGAAIDRLIAMHPAAAHAKEQADAAGQSLPEWLADRAVQQAGGLSETVRLAEGLHVVPEFLGNRAPFADPQARALVAGLGMETDLQSLVALYVAGLCGIACGLRQIVQAQAKAGARVERVVVSGGAARADLVRQLLADVSGLPVVATTAEEPVLLGAAMLGAVGGGLERDLASAMARMSKVGRRHDPAPEAFARLHQARFETFEKLQKLGREIR